MGALHLPQTWLTLIPSLGATKSQGEPAAPPGYAHTTRTSFCRCFEEGLPIRGHSSRDKWGSVTSAKSELAADEL